MSVENVGICKITCKTCKYVKKPFPWFDSDIWKCKARSRGYSCVDGSFVGYATCRIHNEDGECQLYEEK